MSRVIRIVAVVGILLLGAGSVSADVTLILHSDYVNSFRMPMAPQFSFALMSVAGN